MKLTVDILEDFISRMKLSGEILSSTNDGTNTTIIVEKTFHARKNMKIIVDDLEYTIVSVVNNESIEFLGTPSNPISYTVPNPFYFHGTPLMTNNHINRAQDSQKVPMAYLYEILRETEKNIYSSIKRESEIRLFFLDNANFDEWQTDDHYSKRLIGLNNFVNEFITQARKSVCCFYLDETEFTRINHVNWGVYVNNKGNEKRIFDDDLTGVELSFTLPLKDCK